MSVTGCVILSTRQVLSEEFSQCYDDVNICLWTDDTTLTRSAAEAACQQRNKSFLPRVTDSNIQHKLALFRAARYDILGRWIDVSSDGVGDRFHWIDGSLHKHDGMRDCITCRLR